MDIPLFINLIARTAPRKTEVEKKWNKII